MKRLCAFFSILALAVGCAQADESVLTPPPPVGPNPTREILPTAKDPEPETEQPASVPPQFQDTAPREVACACGCGIFDVGGVNWMIPSNPSGGSVWIRYASMNQNQNWEGTSRALASDNGDKTLYTNFFTVGGQYTIDQNWTVMADLPFYDRSFTSTDDGTIAGPAGSIYTNKLFAMGDLKVMGVYTGLSEDMTTGLMFGLKLPTGQSYSRTGPLGGSYYDRDSLPGTGSTDVVLGAYHVGALSGDGKLSYFVQANLQMAFLTRDNYRPGNELDAAAGLSYSLGPLIGTNTSPSLQLLYSSRATDSGANCDPLNSGYSRIFIAPGVEFRFDNFKIYTDVEFPIYQRTNSAISPLIEGTAGQLVAPVLFKFQVGYDF